METSSVSAPHTPTVLAPSCANPYLDEFLEAHAAVGVQPTRPDSLSPEFSALVDLLGARDRLVRKYSWAVPNTAAIATIAARGPVVEIGAGAGYWSMLLAAAGCDVVAYDAYPPSVADNPYTGQDVWFDVQQGGADRAAAHPDRTLLLCWPPYDDPAAADALSAYTGDTVCFVGEQWGGCTGDDRFFELLNERFEEVEYVQIPTWPHIRDMLTVWTAKN